MGFLDGNPRARARYINRCQIKPGDRVTAWANGGQRERWGVFVQWNFTDCAGGDIVFDGDTEPTDAFRFRYPSLLERMIYEFCRSPDSESAD